jgi:transcriptional regulator with XRE-family HTH domain
MLHHPTFWTIAHFFGIKILIDGLYDYYNTTSPILDTNSIKRSSMSAIGDHLTNDEILTEMGSRLRARRLDRNVSVDAAAEAIGVNRKTILEIENGGDIRLGSLLKLLRYMNLLGVLDAVLPDTLPGSEAFSKRGQVRQRAAGTRGKGKKSTPDPLALNKIA